MRLLNEWHCKINDCINNRINVLKRKKSSHKKRQVFKCRENMEYLERFHQQYVLVPADKAG